MYAKGGEELNGKAAMDPTHEKEGPMWEFLPAHTARPWNESIAAKRAAAKRVQRLKIATWLQNSAADQSTGTKYFSQLPIPRWYY